MIQNHRWSITIIVSAALLIGAAPRADEAAGQAPVTADASKQKVAAAGPSKVTKPASSSLRPIVYRPPKVGKPAHSVGGGSRGVSGTMPEFFVAAPNHVGQTVSPKPSLFWYINPVPDGAVAIEFTLLDEESVEPTVETALTRPGGPGLHRIQLSDYDAELTPGTEYQWSVALIFDRDERSKDIVATGFIDRVEPDGDLVARLQGGSKAEAAAVYAGEGIWYDALAVLNEEIEGDPSNAALLHQRADLLRQVGLDTAAEGSLR